MKKILFTAIIIAVASQLKAQQKFGMIDSMLLKAPKNLYQFKLNDSSLFRNFAPKQDQFALLNSLTKNGSTDVFYSRMPVLKISPVERIPVARGANVDNMPIVKLKAVDPLAAKKRVNP